MFISTECKLNGDRHRANADRYLAEGNIRYAIGSLRKAIRNYQAFILLEDNFIIDDAFKEYMIKIADDMANTFINGKV